MSCSLLSPWALKIENVHSVGKEVRGLRSTNRWLQNSHVEVKYRIGDGVAKELTHTTHGHEQWRGGLPEGVGSAG